MWHTAVHFCSGLPHRGGHELALTTTAAITVTTTISPRPMWQSASVSAASTTAVSATTIEVAASVR